MNNHTTPMSKHAKVGGKNSLLTRQNLCVRDRQSSATACWGRQEKKTHCGRHTNTIIKTFRPKQSNHNIQHQDPIKLVPIPLKNKNFTVNVRKAKIFLAEEMSWKWQPSLTRVITQYFRAPPPKHALHLKEPWPNRNNWHPRDKNWLYLYNNIIKF